MLRSSPDWTIRVPGGDRGGRIVSAPRLAASSLDIRPLYYFVHVVESGSFSRAAAALAISQPVLSRFVRRLEDGLKVQLLYRNGRGVGVTEAGQRFFEHAQAVLQTLSQAEIEVAALRGTALGRVSIALPPLLGGVLSAELIRSLKAEYPLVTMTLREGFSAEALEWLSAGSVDIGILFNPPKVATLITQHIFDDRIHLVGAPGSLEEPGGSEIPMRRLAALAMILPPAPHRLRSLIEDASHEAGITLSTEVEVSGTNTMLELVRKRIGFTILPSALLKDELAEGRIMSWPIGEPGIVSHLFTATSMQRPQTLATRAVLKTIGEVFKRNLA
jgi:LysR family nitrogen assimilation transcriptional regulator